MDSNYGTSQYQPTWIQGYYDNGSGGNGTKDILLQPDGGNVGIGTTSPGAKLTVGGKVGISTGTWVTSTLLDIGTSQNGNTKGQKDWDDSSWRHADYHMWFRNSRQPGTTTQFIQIYV